jgi:8-oxo-dGTP diphosphatase
VTAPRSHPPRIVVTAAVIRRDDEFLITRRLSGTHLAGCWEFPGGKCEPGERHESCLEREILEELGTSVRIEHRLLSVTHAYAERTVELHFFACALLDEPSALLGQEMRWVSRRDLASLEFPPADAELIALLQNGP